MLAVFFTSSLYFFFELNFNPGDPEFGGIIRPTGTCFFHTLSPQESLQKLMQDIKLLSYQLNDKIYDLANESALAVLAQLSIQLHSGSAHLTRFRRCATQSESSVLMCCRHGSTHRYAHSEDLEPGVRHSGATEQQRTCSNLPSDSSP